MASKPSGRRPAVGAFPSKTEGMFLSILFAHHQALKQLQGKVEKTSQLVENMIAKPQGLGSE